MAGRRVRSRDIEANSVNSRLIAAGAVTQGAIADGAIYGPEIRPGSVSGAHLQAQAVRIKHLHPELLPLGGGGSIITVASADASEFLRTRSHYRCDGTADNVEISHAITDAGIGGTVMLVGESFTLSATVLVDQGVRLVGESVAYPLIYTDFEGSAFQIKPGGSIEYMKIDTAGYFGGSTNDGIAIEGVEQTDGTGFWHVKHVETITTGEPGIMIDNSTASRKGNIWIQDCPIFRTEGTGEYGIEIYNARHVFIRDCQGHDTAGASGPGTNTGIYIDEDTINVDIMGGDWIGDIDVHGNAVRVVGVDGSNAGRVRLQASSSNSIVIACMRMNTISDAGTGNQLANNNVAGSATSVRTDPATSVVAETSYGQASSVGASTTDHARSDHTHGTPALPTPAQIGAAEDDHSHAGSGEQLVADGVTPIEALTNEAEDDWLYEG